MQHTSCTCTICHSASAAQQPLRTHAFCTDSLVLPQLLLLGALFHAPSQVQSTVINCLCSLTNSWLWHKHSIACHQGSYWACAPPIIAQVCPPGCKRQSTGPMCQCLPLGMTCAVAATATATCSSCFREISHPFQPQPLLLLYSLATC